MGFFVVVVVVFLSSFRSHHSREVFKDSVSRGGKYFYLVT